MTTSQFGVLIGCPRRGHWTESRWGSFALLSRGTLAGQGGAGRGHCFAVFIWGFSVPPAGQFNIAEDLSVRISVAVAFSILSQTRLLRDFPS